jgi:hypothetical protein
VSVRKAHRIGAWRFVYEGGRLADVFHDSAPDEAVDCLQACDYDFVTGTASFNVADFKARCQTWVEEDGETFMENVVKYR